MGFEASPPNEFRASVRRGGGPLVVAKKNVKVDPSFDGLEAVKVPRSEKRRTDERGDDRHRLGGEQTLLRRKGKNHKVELINLSHGGAMVAGDLPVKLWDKVELMLGESANFECAVCWIRDGKIGLEFAHETRIDCDSSTREELFREVIRKSFPDVEIKARPARTGGRKRADQKRAASRHPLIWTGVLHHDYQRQEAQLRNISATGAMLECSDRVPVGAAVFLDLKEAGRIAAQVSWSHGEQTGLVFDEPFDVSSLAKATPLLASKTGAKAKPAPDGGERAQSPWAPHWNRLSIDELGAELGG
jgi:hypothetical protein